MGYVLADGWRCEGVYQPHNTVAPIPPRPALPGQVRDIRATTQKASGFRNQILAKNRSNTQVTARRFPWKNICCE